jgi:hypothetical protein
MNRQYEPTDEKVSVTLAFGTIREFVAYDQWLFAAQILLAFADFGIKNGQRPNVLAFSPKQLPYLPRGFATALISGPGLNVISHPNIGEQEFVIDYVEGG